MPAVRGLAKEFPGKVDVTEEDATTKVNAPLMKKLGFDNHGLVIRAENGAVLWSEADHDVRIEDVRSAIRKLLKE